MGVGVKVIDHVLRANCLSMSWNIGPAEQPISRNKG